MWRSWMANYLEFQRLDDMQFEPILRTVIDYLHKIWQARGDQDAQNRCLNRLRLYHEKIIALGDPRVRDAQRHLFDQEGSHTPLLSRVFLVMERSLDEHSPITPFTIILTHLSKSLKRTFTCPNDRPVAIRRSADCHPYFFYSPGRKRYCSDECAEAMQSHLNAERQRNFRKRNDRRRTQ